MITATTVQNFEQKYAVYQHIALYCAIAAGVFLVLTIILFLVLKIPQVFGELTGRTARKAVQEMRQKTIRRAEVYKKGMFHPQRRKHPEKIKEQKNRKNRRPKGVPTTILSEKMILR